MRMQQGNSGVQTTWDTVVKHYHINIFWSEEDGGYIADIPDLEACSALGLQRRRP
jgi:hypothetical protein